MPDDRRSAPRARVPGVGATFEGATGELHRAEVLDIGAGGLFLSTRTLAAVGKRLSLEMVVAGEPGPWSALVRVVWVRPTSEGPDRPAGLGVKLIDADEAVVAGILRLVAKREPTEPGMAGAAAPRPRAPARERTMLGVGTIVGVQPITLPPAPRPGATPPAPTPRPAPVPVPEAPIVVLDATPEPPPRETPTVILDATPEPPARETPTVVRAATPEPPREPSFAIDLVAKKPPSDRAPPVWNDALDSADSAEPEPTDEELRLPKNTGVAWLLFLLAVIAAAAITAYAFRSRLPAAWHWVKATTSATVKRLH